MYKFFPFLLILICPLSFSQTLDWKTFAASEKKGLISNVGFLAQDGVERFDYQGAMFGEYSPDKKILLHVIVFQVSKSEKKGFIYSCTDRRNEDNIMLIRTAERVKGLNTNAVAFFLCNFAMVWPITTTNRTTGVKRDVKVPVFDATQAWTTLQTGE